MRNLSTAATLAAMLLGLLVRPAAAQEFAPVVEQSAPPAPAPVASVTSATPDDSARARELQDRLFAREALSLTGRRISQGDVLVNPGRLYFIVGRPDLAEQIRRRRFGKGIAIGAGIGVAAVGTIWGVVDSAATSLDNAWNRAVNLCGTQEVDERCADRSQASMIPWAVAIGGGIVALTGVAVPSDPLNQDEKRALIDGHNQRLRGGTGLSSALDAARRTANVRPAVQPDGQSGMLLASCAF